MVEVISKDAVAAMPIIVEPIAKPVAAVMKTTNQSRSTQRPRAAEKKTKDFSVCSASSAFKRRVFSQAFRSGCERGLKPPVDPPMSWCAEGARHPLSNVAGL